MTNLTLEEKKELIRMALAAREKAYVPTAILWWALPCAPRMAAFLPAATWRTLPLPPPAVQNARLCSSGGRGCDRVHRHCCGGQPPRRGERTDHLALRCVPSGTVRVRRAGAERDHGQNAGGFHRAQHGRTAALWVRAFQCGRKCRCGKINRFPAQNRNGRTLCKGNTFWTYLQRFCKYFVIEKCLHLTHLPAILEPVNVQVPAFAGRHAMD